MAKPGRPLCLFHEFEIGTTRIIWGETADLCPHISTYLPDNIIKEGEQKFASQTRRDEWLSTRLLLHLAYKGHAAPPAICYQPNGRPFLQGSKKSFSITHSKGRVCIALSDKEAVGIDIERLSERPYTLRDMFVSPADLSADANLPPEAYTILWSAKESLFKISEVPRLTLKDIHIMPFSPMLSGGNIRAYIGRTPYTVFYRFLSSFVFTCVEE